VNKMDLLIVGAFGAIGLTLAIALNLIPITKQHNVVSSGYLTDWFARHPDGTFSKIEYYRTDAEGNRVWKFDTSEEEVIANPGEDYFEDERAREGLGFFNFRVNSNGSITEWDSPDLRDYFSRKVVEKEREMSIAEKVNYIDSLEARNKRSMEKRTVDGQSEDYVDLLGEVEVEKAKGKEEKAKKGFGVEDLEGVVSGEEGVVGEREES